MRNTENETLDDIVFEHRNKEYGAYFLRKNYSKFLNRATVIGVGVFITIFGGSWTYQKYILPNLPDEEVKTVEVNLKDLKQPEEEKPLDVAPPPPPPPPPPPQEVAQIKFLPPEPKEDELVVIEEPPPPIEDLKTAVISDRTVKGADADLDFTPPPPPPVVPEVKLEKTDEETIFTSVEQHPEFPGGQSEMYRFINSIIKYPSAAQRQNISGRVFVKFVIEKDGSIGAVEVMKGIGFGCDEEAIRVIKAMPKWNPGKQNGKNVRVYYNMPVFYQLD